MDVWLFLFHFIVSVCLSIEIWLNTHRPRSYVWIMQINLHLHKITYWLWLLDFCWRLPAHKQCDDSKKVLFFHCSICRRNIYSIDNQWWLFQFNLSVIYRTLSVTGHAYSYNDSRNSVCVMEAWVSNEFLWDCSARYTYKLTNENRAAIWYQRAVQQQISVIGNDIE